MSPLPKNTALILVDVQEAFNDPKWGQRNNPDAEKNIAALLAAWRKTQRPVIHVQHRSRKPHSLFHPDNPGFKLKPEATPLPSEPVILKEVNSSFIGTDLEQRLRDMGTTTVVIAGITTDQCVSTTVRMSGNLGFTTYLVADATATFERRGYDGRYFNAQDMHEAALASVHEEFATVLDSAAVMGML